MHLIIKLLDREPFTIQVKPDTSIRRIKEMVHEYLRIPIEEQKLIFRGIILSDDKNISSYVGIDAGCKLHLIMVTKKKHPLYKKVYDILRPHYSEKETQKILSIFMRKVYDSFRQLSLDDLERIAHTALAENSNPEPEKMIVDEEVLTSLR